MTHAEYAEGLRLIADFFEAHPEVNLPYDAARFDYFGLHSREQLTLIAKALGSCAKAYGVAFPESFELQKMFGKIQFRAITNRDKVCERVSVGKRTVIREVPVGPPQPTEKREVEEDIIEWRCSDAALLETEHA